MSNFQANLFGNSANTRSKITKEELVQKLIDIHRRGWIPNRNPRGSRTGDGAAGNIMEDVLGIPENNFTLADAGEWEIKTQRSYTSSLVSLFAYEPEPRNAHIVPKILLPKYGWKQTGMINEKSFRATLSGAQYSDRGFKVVVDRDEEKLKITFNRTRVSSSHREWLKNVEHVVGLGEINPQPYWKFDTIAEKIETKLKNLIYVIVEEKIKDRVQQFKFNHALLISEPSINKFISGIERGFIYIDFNARTHHNHGTRFRIRQEKWDELYSKREHIF
jgi:hypothetical protein